ncbi:hypothetical protein A9259_07965 [Vibrio cyclitrophicus]|uniref:AAA family ATPase n=1 Tax=Vibrio cyclitrophicus TaxID=47951 RepID=UPI0007EEF384|nr:AAA family ATPase [Vibrio cyclitrophicus]OBS98384.1 hypothetical protein A9259_07965 [Vibrio cyclitrophicus]
MISFKISKKHKIKNITNIKYDFRIPIGSDRHTYDIRKSYEFQDFLTQNNQNLKVKLNDIFSYELFCYYCGSAHCSVISGFLQDRSALNTWIFDRIDCSVVMCKECNKNYGKNHVNYIKRVSELKGSGRTEKNLLKFEPEILIPTLDDIDSHISYDIRSGLLIGLTERARNTIDFLGLNRFELVESRFKFINEYSEHYITHNKFPSVKSIFNSGFIIKKLNEKNGSYISSKNARLILNIDDIIKDINNAISKSLDTFNLKIDVKFTNNSNKKTNNEERKKHFSDYNNPGVLSFNFSGLRGFLPEQVLRFNGRNNILLLGENGVGKSTLLSSLKTAFQKNFNIVPFLDESYDESSSKIYIKYQNGDKRFFIKNNVTIGNYHINNVIYINDSRTSKKDVDELIDSILKHRDNYELTEWVLKRLNTILGFDHIKIINNNILVIDEKTSRQTYLHELSSGFTSLICIFNRICKKLQIFNHINLYSISKYTYSTIILIDEIELHLHPTFKKDIVGKLSNAFPEAIFIMSTHDPLVIRSCGESCDIKLLRKIDNRTEIFDELPNHTNLTTEQILTSPIFNLSTTNSKNKEDKINLYNTAIEEKNWVLVNKLRNELTDVGYFGKTYRELLALTAVDAYLKMGITPSIDQIIAEIKLMEEDDA